MTPAVKLMDLTDALEMMPEEMGAWLDLQTGLVVMVEDKVIRAIEEAEGDSIPAGLVDWQKDELSVARGICAGDKRYLSLPDKFDFHEYRHIERFIGTIGDAGIANQLWFAIKGKGAFRRFKDTALRLGLIDDWYRLRDEAMNRFMLDWAETNGIQVDQTPRRPGPE